MRCSVAGGELAALRVAVRLSEVHRVEGAGEVAGRVTRAFTNASDAVAESESERIGGRRWG
jgi:hypothetical protein